MIDSSDLFALEPDVPLVVPDVNPQVLADYRNRNIITVADSLTSQLLCAIKPLVEQAGGASAGDQSAVGIGAGQSGGRFAGGRKRAFAERRAAEEHYFGRQLAFNMLPQLPDSAGSVASERRTVDQVRKVLQDEGLPIAVSSVQAPVFYGNAQIVHLESLRPLSAEEARDELSRMDEIVLSDENDYPTRSPTPPTTAT